MKRATKSERVASKKPREAGVADFTSTRVQSEVLLAVTCATRDVTVLDVSGWNIPTPVLLGAVSNAKNLKRLVATSWGPKNSWERKVFNEAEVEDLLLATPPGCQLVLDVEMLDPMATLSNPRLSIIHAECALPSRYGSDGTYTPNTKEVKLLIKALKKHSELKSFTLSGPALSEQDVAMVCTFASALESLEFFDCGINHLALPHLARFLRTNDALRRLVIDGDDPDASGDVFCGPGLQDFCEALRASRLEVFHARACNIWGCVDDGCALVAACKSHPTIAELSFANNTSSHLTLTDQKKMGKAYASLVNVRSALTSLDMYWNDLFDPELAIMAPFFKALAKNKTLSSLDIGLNEIWVVRDWKPMLTAFRACPSLRAIECDLNDLNPSNDWDEFNYRIYESEFFDITNELAAR